MMGCLKIFMVALVALCFQSGPSEAAKTYGGRTVGSALAVARIAKGSRLVIKPVLKPRLGKKLDYFFGAAKGSAHTMERTREMRNTLRSVGLFDKPAHRKHFVEHLRQVARDPSSALATPQPDGRLVREGLLMGPNGGVMTRTI